LVSATKKFKDNCFKEEGLNSTQWQAKIKINASAILATKIQENYEASESTCKSHLKRLYFESPIVSSVDNRYSVKDGLSNLRNDINQLESTYNSNQEEVRGPAKRAVYETFYKEEVMQFIARLYFLEGFLSNCKQLLS
jgi:hypothetical protein